MTKKSQPRPKLTPTRVKVFAEALHRGLTKSAAYREMSPSSKKWTPGTVHNRASTWAAQDEVKAKVKELEEEAAERNRTTVDQLDRMHKEAFEMGIRTEKASAMTAAAKNLGELHGLNNNKLKVVTDDGHGNDESINKIKWVLVDGKDDTDD